MDIKTPGLIDHASSHIDAGADEIDGDKLVVTWTPANYVRDSTTPSESDADDQLTAHLQGIDTELGSIVAGAFSGYIPTVNVLDYGAVADGSTDDATAIQNAIDAISSPGGKVFFPAGTYRIATGLVLSDAGTELCGEGHPGCTNSNGTSVLLVDDGETGISANVGGAQINRGFVIRNLCLQQAASTGGGDGIVIASSGHNIIEDVCCRYFEAGAGLVIDGESNTAICSVIRNFSTGHCKYGVHLTGTSPNSTRMFGGYIVGGLIANSIGIWVETGDGFRAHGVSVDTCATAFYLESSGKCHELHGFRAETNTIGVRIGASADNFLMSGGMIYYNGGGTCIQVDSGATSCVFMPTYLYGTTEISDSGTNTIWLTYAPTE